MSGADAAARFTSRANDYARYRPSYPPELCALLRHSCGLRPGAVVADVGAGTGILTRLLAAAGATVHAVEPNAAMRAAAGDSSFVCGRAEATGLATGSCDLVVAAQAFHWFEPAAARAEFRRILRPGGAIALIWNWREATSSPFLAGYEALLDEFAGEHRQVAVEHMDPERIAAFFAPAVCRRAQFPNHQDLDRAGLRGRLLSASYVPEAGDPRHAPMLVALDELYARHQRHGFVRLRYVTRVYYASV